MTTRNSAVLYDFVEYCNKNPDQRFWQALRNWSGSDFILYWESNEFDFHKAQEMGLHDTFYWENKNN